ncbi:unnamed protein product [Lasius platythorax]|uniref:Uncharacterized protein n=1 Tax=Lasius platythorax TaxID=488582 RepID=A0AAV2NLT1_9HYME
MNSFDLPRSTKQAELMQQVCTELEKENKDDTKEIKKRRLESILKLTTKMQRRVIILGGFWAPFSTVQIWLNLFVMKS